MRYGSLIVALTVLLSVVPGGVVSETNEPPVVDAGLDQSVERDETIFLDAGGTFDPDGEIATYSWTVETPSGSTLTPHDPDAERTSFEAIEEGRYYVTLTAADDDGSSRSDTLFVDVAGADDGDEDGNESDPDNRPPTGAIAGPDSVVRGTSATFSADAYDPDGDIESHAWSIDGDGREVRRTFSEPVGSRVTLSVQVTDDDGASTRFTKSVTVVAGSGRGGDSSENDAPTVGIEGPSRVGVGEPATFLLSTSDSDGTVVRRTWTAPVSGTGSTLTHSFDAGGTYAVTARVTDEDGAASTATHSVEVYGSGEPVASISGPETAPSGSTHTYTLDAYDPDGGELTITWNPVQTQWERGATRFENVVTIETPPGGTESVSATVTDDEGNSVTVVKNTEVTSVTGEGRLLNAPEISDIRAFKVMDDGIQTSASDTIEAGTYAFSTDVSTNEREFVTVRWDFNDSTTMTDSLGRFNGTRTSAIEHQFISEKGNPLSVGLRVKATDAEGNSMTKKWVSRVQPIAAANNSRLAASYDGQTAPSGSTLEVPVGASVKFQAFSLQHFRIEFGDGKVGTSSGSTDFQKFSHKYDSVGIYTVQLTTIQGPGGYGARRLRVNVTRNSYSEYWFKVRSKQFERTVSPHRPPGERWTRVRVNHAERYFTGSTITYEGSGGNHLTLGDAWVITDTYTEQRPDTESVVRQTDPDGAGGEWTLSESRVEQETKTTYEDEYRWFEDEYGAPGWSRTGETRAHEVVVGDGHDHDRTRRTDRERTSCADWRLDPSPFGGFDPVCTSWNYDTDVWYTGHDHDGRTYQDVDYRYHREVERTGDVWLHRYSRTTTETVQVTELSETASRDYWLWERMFDTEYRTEYSLTEPRDESFIEGTLHHVTVECGSDQSHFDSVMC